MRLISYKIGINGGIPVGDISDFFSFDVSADFAYLFEVSDQIKVGPAVSVLHFFGDDLDTGFGTIEFEDATFIPIGGTARFSIAESFVIGADLGYGLGVSPDGNDGGFFYKPQAIYMVSDNFGIKASYAGVSVDSVTFGAVNLGIEFGL